MTDLQERTTPPEFEEPEALSEDTFLGLAYIGSAEPAESAQAERALSTLPPELSPEDVNNIYEGLAGFLEGKFPIQYRFGGQVNRHARGSLRFVAMRAKSRGDDVTHNSIQEWGAASRSPVRKLLGKLVTYI